MKNKYKIATLLLITLISGCATENKTVNIKEKVKQENIVTKKQIKKKVYKKGKVTKTKLKYKKVKKMKKFNIKRFEKNISKGINPITEADGTVVYQGGDSKSGYDEIRTNPKTPLFEEEILYYPTGERKRKRVSYKKYFFHGITYIYNKKGEIISTKDYNKGFDFSWEDLRKYCEKNNIDLSDEIFTRIRKEGTINLFDETEKEAILNEKDKTITIMREYFLKNFKVLWGPAWDVQYLNKEKNTALNVVIDAKQGNIILIYSLDSIRSIHDYSTGITTSPKQTLVYKYGDKITPEMSWLPLKK